MDDLEHHLIARVLPEAYAPRPGQPRPEYSEQQARHVLAFLAQQMNQDHTRDLAWWQIPRWAPVGPRIVASMLASGLLGAALGGVTTMFAHALGAVLGAVLRVEQNLWSGLGSDAMFGLLFGLGVGLSLGLGFGRGGREPKRIRTWRGISVRSVLVAGFAYGLAYVLAVMLVPMVVIAYSALLVADLNAFQRWLTWIVPITLGLVAGLPLRLKRDLGGGLSDKSRRKRRAGVLVAVLMVGLVPGIALAYSTDAKDSLLWERIVGVLLLWLVAGLVVGFVVWLVLGLVPRLAGRFVGGLAIRFVDGERSSQGPRESWRSDRVFGIVAGLAFGLAFGFMVGLACCIVDGLGKGVWFEPVAVAGSGLRFGLMVGLVSGLGLGLPLGVVYGITSSVTWPTTLAWLQLRRSRRVPAVGLMPFLEDARERAVLRTVGAVYQFRHATLQEHLAEQTTSRPRVLGGPRPVVPDRFRSRSSA